MIWQKQYSSSEAFRSKSSSTLSKTCVIEVPVSPESESHKVRLHYRRGRGPYPQTIYSLIS